MPLKRSPALYWLIAAFALTPALLFAYLGQFSRIIADDYCYMSEGQSMGVWDGMLYMRDHWTGAYTSLLFKYSIAPLDTLAPRVMPAIITALWLAGSCWLVWQGLARLGVNRSRRALATAIAAFIVTASINAFHSPQSFYWYASSIRYTLPLALLVIYLALTFRRGKTSLLGIIAGGLLCFISAGFSEVFVTFQSVFLTICLLMSLAFLRNGARRRYALAFGVGWLATLAGLVIQLSAPGTARRAARLYERSGLGPLDWDMASLASKTLNWTVDYIGEPQVFLGFILLMAVGLLVMLIQYKPQTTLKTGKPVELALPSLWLGLILQLLYAVAVAVHASFHWRHLRHFRREYMAIAILHIVLLLGFMILFWWRKRVNAQLQKRDPGLLAVCSVIVFVFAFVLLFALTYAKASLHPHPPDNPRPDYLLMSFLVFMGVMLWWLSAALSSAVARKYGLLAVCLHSIGLICMTVVVFTALLGRRHVDFRILSANAWLLALPGLVWGVFFGGLLKHYPPASRFGQAWVKLLKPACLVVVLPVALGIVLGQAALMPNFQRYADEWDARYQGIITERDSGQKAVEILPLTWELGDYLGITDFLGTKNSCPADYFDVDSIVMMGQLNG